MLHIQILQQQNLISCCNMKSLHLLFIIQLAFCVCGSCLWEVIQEVLRVYHSINIEFILFTMHSILKWQKEWIHKSNNITNNQNLIYHAYIQKKAQFYIQSNPITGILSEGFEKVSPENKSICKRFQWQLYFNKKQKCQFGQWSICEKTVRPRERLPFSSYRGLLPLPK